MQTQTLTQEKQTLNIDELINTWNLNGQCECGGQINNESGFAICDKCGRY